MAITIAKSVNFGAIKGSLSTVGYTLKNYDGSTKLARTTSGITELVSGKGIYGGNLSFENGWSGFLIWDSGDASPYYAIENFDYRAYSEGGGTLVSVGSQSVPHKDIWTEKEKKKVIKMLDLIMSQISSSNGDVIESLRSHLNEIKDKKIDFSEIKSQIRETQAYITTQMLSLEPKDIVIPDMTENLKLIEKQYGELKESLSPILFAIEALIESEMVRITLKENQNETLEHVEQ